VAISWQETERIVSKKFPPVPERVFLAIIGNSLQFPSVSIILNAPLTKCKLPVIKACANVEVRPIIRALSRAPSIVSSIYTVLLGLYALQAQAYTCNFSTEDRALKFLSRTRSAHYLCFSRDLLTCIPIIACLSFLSAYVVNIMCSISRPSLSRDSLIMRKSSMPSRSEKWLKMTVLKG
jgi:hypothetical protein